VRSEARSNRDIARRGAQRLGQVLNHCQYGLWNNNGNTPNVCDGTQGSYFLEVNNVDGLNPDAPTAATGNDRYFARTDDGPANAGDLLLGATCYNQYAMVNETVETGPHLVRCFSPSIKLGHSGSPCTNTLANAITYCEGYTGDGASDWRLPQTVEEAGYTCGSGSGSGCGSLGFLGGGGDSTDQWVLFPASSPTIP